MSKDSAAVSESKIDAGPVASTTTIHLSLQGKGGVGKSVPDEIWNEAARHYDERSLAGLLLAIATVNVWNRLNVSTRQIPGNRLRSAEARR